MKKNSIATTSIAGMLGLLVALAGAPPAGAATIVDFDFSGIRGDEVHDKNTFELTATNTLHPNVELVEGVNIFSPSALEFHTSGGQSAYDMNLRNWGTASTLQQAINGDRFVSYTIAPEPGHLLNLNNAAVSFDLWRNGPAAPNDYYLLVNSVGGPFTTDHQVGQLIGVTDAGVDNTHTFTATLPEDGFGAVGPVEVRLYGQRADNSSANTHLAGATITGAEVFDVVLATDFAGRTVSGLTASNIPWQTNGVANPGDLTASDGFFLFDTSPAQDKFAVRRNIGNEGPWTVDISLAVEGLPIDLAQLSMDWFIFSNAGALQGPNRQLDVELSLLDDAMNVLWSDSVLDVYPQNESPALQPQRLSFDLSGTDRLLANTDYVLQIEASSRMEPGFGNNAGIGSLMLAGHVVPEPGTWLLLLSAVACGLLVRRRKKEGV